MFLLSIGKEVEKQSLEVILKVMWFCCWFHRRHFSTNLRETWEEDFAFILSQVQGRLRVKYLKYFSINCSLSHLLKTKQPHTQRFIMVLPKFNHNVHSWISFAMNLCGKGSHQQQELRCGWSVCLKMVITTDRTLVDCVNSFFAV